MFRKARWTLALTTIAVVVFAATEGAVISMAASAIGRLGPTENGSLFNRERIHALQVTEQFSLLAAGDIAACRVNGGTERFGRNIRYSLGIERPELEPNEGMLVTSSILSRHPDLNVLALGDLAYKRGEPVAFSDCYDPYWGQARDRTWPVPGNHEYQSVGAYGYFDYWGERAGPDRAGYYALQAGNWTILSLNSEIDASEDSDQALWIDSVVTKNPDACIGAFFHKPAFSAVERNNSENSKLLFARVAEVGAVFVLNGHNHFFERSVPLDAKGLPSPDGTTIFVAGAGGKVAGGNISANDQTADLVVGVPGVLKMDFSSQSVEWSYLSDEVNTSSASGTLTCS